MRDWLATNQIYGQPDTVLDALINLEIGLHTQKDTP